MEWATQGQVVDARLGEKWLRCLVVCVMGNTARVVNELHAVDTWVYLDDLREVPPGPRRM